MKKILCVLCCIMITLSGLSVGASAAPTNTYKHAFEPSGKPFPALAREMYTTSQTITASSLGLEDSLVGLTDICRATDGTVYILCGEESRLVVLNKDYTVKSEISIVDDNGEVNFKGAKGIYVDKKGIVYIADSQNGRVIIADQGGKIKQVWEAPVSTLIPDDFLYQPVSVAVDDRGYTYILSLGCFYGALVYSPAGEFIGFYGSNTVKASPLDMLSFLWDKLTKTDAKRAASLKTMPYSFVDLALDAEGYMVTCTGKTEETIEKGQIRKISPNGQDILYQRASDGSSLLSSDVNFMENERSKRHGYQNMISLSVDNDGFLYALDETYGLIYVYDNECNLLNSFGGGIKSGIQKGTFHTPVSISSNGSSILVADSNTCAITVFETTPYGALLREANILYAKGDYEKAKPLWEQVLAQDRGNQLAYRGLAMSSFSEGNYQVALKYAKAGLDYTVYDMAWRAVLTNFITDHFVWIFFFVLVAIAGMIAFIVCVKKRKAIMITNPKIKTLFSVAFHPFRSFEDLKYKKYGSVAVGVFLSVMLYIAFVLRETASGFLFTTSSPLNYNMLYTLAQTLGLILLWSVSNWLICSLFSGKGRLSEVFTATAYSLVPLVIFSFVRVILSHVLPVSGLNIMNGIETLVWIFTFFLLCIAMMTVHEYDFFKFLLTSLAVVFLMIMIVFVLFLFVSLFRQVIDFIYVVYEEIAYR